MKLKNAIRVRQNLRIGHFRKPCTKNDAPAENHGIQRSVYLLKTKDKATFNFPTQAWLMPAPSSKKPEEREFVVDTRVSMHMLNKKDLSSDEL